MKKILQRYSHPVRGIVYALKHDRNYRNQVYLIGIVVAGKLWFINPFAA